MPKLTFLAPAALCLALVSGCGSSSSGDSSSASTPSSPTTSAPAASTGTAAAGGKFTVVGTEYAFAPSSISAKAGKVKITLDNKGAIPHELIVLKTSADPGSLKVGQDQRVSEKGSVGEVSEIPGAATKTATLDLKPGKYVYVCNIPTHYADGMHGQLTVK
jgi:uncharacterized cupredoxin-like copper-binding protein